MTTTTISNRTRSKINKMKGNKNRKNVPVSERIMRTKTMKVTDWLARFNEVEEVWKKYGPMTYMKNDKSMYLWLRRQKYNFYSKSPTAIKFNLQERKKRLESIGLQRHMNFTSVTPNTQRKSEIKETTRTYHAAPIKNLSNKKVSKTHQGSVNTNVTFNNMIHKISEFWKVNGTMTYPKYDKKCTTGGEI